MLTRLRRDCVLSTAVVWFATAVLGPAAEQPSRPTNLDLNSALRLYQAAVDSVVSYDVRVTIEQWMLIGEQSAPVPDGAAQGSNAGGPPKETVTYRKLDAPKKLNSIVSRQYLSDGCYRIDSLRDHGVEHAEGTLANAWDGDTQVSLNADRKTATLRGDAASNVLMGSPSLSYAMLYRMAFGNYAYAECVRQRPATIERRGSFWRVDVAPENLKPVHMGEFGVEIDFDAEKAFMPARILWYGTKKTRRVNYTLIENQLSEIQPGVWMPLAARVTYLIANPDSPFFGQPRSYDDVTLDRERSRFNIPLDESVFNLKIPNGYSVRDDVRHASYISGAESREDVLDGLAAEGRIGVAALRQTQPSQGLFSHRYMFLIIFGNCMLIISVAVGLLVRSCGRKPQ